MPRSSALLTSPASILAPHQPPPVHFRSPFIPHPLPSAQPSFPPLSIAVSPSCPERSRGVSTAFLPQAKPKGTPDHAVSPLFVAFTPNRPLTPLSTAFTQSHRGGRYPRVYLRQLRVTIHDFVRPLFSYSYELLFPQALYFDNHLNCPGVSPSARLFHSALSVRSVVNSAFSWICALFISLAALFSTPVLCFQSFAHSLTKTPGGGVCVSRLL